MHNTTLALLHENAFYKQLCLHLFGMFSTCTRYFVKGITRFEISGCLFYLYDLTLIPTWISNYMPGKVWDDIIYLYLNLQPTHYDGCDYISMLAKWDYWTLVWITYWKHRRDAGDLDHYDAQVTFCKIGLSAALNCVQPNKWLRG